MGRHERRASAAKGRRDRVAAFRQQSGGAGYQTSLFLIGECPPRYRAAVANWYLAEPTTKPSCFGCRANFSASAALRPSAFLVATSIRSPSAGVAVSGCCSACWTSKSADEIERAALSALHRNLRTGRFADGDQ
jgi:hypothetical protein